MAPDTTQFNIAPSRLIKINFSPPEGEVLVVFRIPSLFAIGAKWLKSYFKIKKNRECCLRYCSQRLQTRSNNYF